MASGRGVGYWRAWNRRALGRLDGAAADVDAARPLLFNAAVPTLAGFIAFERDQLDRALAELSLSRERNAADCEVLFAVGQVHARRSAWPDAAAAYGETIACTQAAQRAAAVKQKRSPVRRSTTRGGRACSPEPGKPRPPNSLERALPPSTPRPSSLLRASRSKSVRSPSARSPGKRSPLVPVSCWAGCLPAGDS